MKHYLTGAIAGALSLAAMSASVQAGVGKAVVRSLKGAAEYSEAGSWQALKIGAELAPGAQVRTGNDASVDLYLDQKTVLIERGFAVCCWWWWRRKRWWLAPPAPIAAFPRSSGGGGRISRTKNSAIG